MSAFLRRAFREPLLHFLALGGVLYVLWASFGPSKPNQIVIPEDLLRAKTEDLTRRTGKAPTDAEVKASVRDYIESEVLYREASKRQLGEGDIIVRRRLVEKMEYVAAALHPFPKPQEADLLAFFRAHADRYILPPRVTAKQVFVSFERHKERAREQALRLAEKLEQGADPLSLGEPHALGPMLASVSQDELVRVFSQEIADALFGFPVRKWSPPVRSAHGFHLFFVLNIETAKEPSFPSIRERLRLDLLEKHRPEHRQQAIQQLVQQYEVIWP